MKKKYYILYSALVAIISIICIIILYSPFKRDDLTDITSDSNISIQISETELPSQNPKLLQSKLYTYDPDELKKLFFSDQNVSLQTSDETIGKNYFYEGDDAILVNNYKWLTYDKNDSVNNYKLLITEFGNSSYFSSDLKQRFPRKIENDADFAKASAIMNTYLTGLHFPDMAPSDVYYLDQYSLNKVEREIISDDDYQKSTISRNRIRNWKKDNEAYLFIYKLSANGIPLSQSTYTTLDGSISIDASFLYAIIGTQGLLCLESLGRFEVINQADVDLLSSKQALDIVTDMYDNIILPAKTSINNVRLVYYPSYDQKKKIFNLIPSWVFQILTYYSDTDVSESSVTVNSMNGEIMSK